MVVTIQCKINCNCVTFWSRYFLVTNMTVYTEYICFDVRWTFSARKEAEFGFQSLEKTKLNVRDRSFHSFQSRHLQVHNLDYDDYPFPCQGNLLYFLCRVVKYSMRYHFIWSLQSQPSSSSLSAKLCPAIRSLKISIFWNCINSCSFLCNQSSMPENCI